MAKKPTFRSPTLAALYDAIVAAGWRTREGSKHVLAYPPDGSPAIALSKTAFDGTENLKLVARAKRGGLTYPKRGR